MPRVRIITLINTTTLCIPWLLIAGCEDNNGEPLTIASSDGLAEINIPEGALPEDADVGEIEMNPIDVPENITVGTMWGHAYELLPDGLQLQQPATITLVVDQEEIVGTIGVLHVFDDQMELITDVDIELHEEEDLTASFEIDHFSYVVPAYVDVGLTAEIVEPAEGSRIIVGESFDVKIDMSYVAGTRTEVKEKHHSGDVVRVLRVARNEPWVIEKGSAHATAHMTPRDQMDIPPSSTIATGALYSVEYEATCESKGPVLLAYRGLATPRFDLTYRNDLSEVYDEDVSLLLVNYTAATVFECVDPHQACNYLEDVECDEDSDCEYNEACSAAPECACGCSIARGAGCEANTDCREGIEICVDSTCECECSVDMGAECDHTGGCSDPKRCSLSRCECVCDMAAGAACESDDDCWGEVCNLDSCACEADSSISSGVGMNDDQVSQWLDLIKESIDDGEPTPLSDGSRTQRPNPPQTPIRISDPILELSESASTRIFDDTFTCGGGTLGLTVCADGASATAGSYLFLVTEFADDIPIEGSETFQYAYVFDSDGDSGNNWVPLSAYPYDFFADTDLWFELTYSSAVGWEVLVRDVRSGDPVEVWSGARFVINGAELGIFVPVEEFDTLDSTFRVTAFAHTGDYGLDGGPWSGDYYPTLENPLLPTATDTVFTIEM